MQRSFISLFSGAGGLDSGLVQAGWSCRYASDIDPLAVATLRLNADAGTLVQQADVTQLTGLDILNKIGAARGEIPLLAGGPPCQSWSSAGHQRGWDDPRGKLFRDFVRIADEVDARFVMFENVRGLLTARGPDGVPGSALELIRSQLLDRGYSTSVTLLNAADYGVPQRRVRLFVLGFRSGDADIVPAPTHAKQQSDDLAAWRSLAACLAEIVPPSATEIVRPAGKLAEQLSSIPAGSGVKSMGKTERTRPGGHWGYKQGAFVADLALPARTVTANAQQDWVRDPNLGLRKLSPRECAAIQSFPVGFRWPKEAKTTDLYRLVGNSVPPKLAYAFGKNLLQILERDEAHRREPPRLLPLPDKLAAAVRYTAREEASNGESRRAVAPKRRASSKAAGLEQTWR